MRLNGVGVGVVGGGGGLGSVVVGGGGRRGSFAGGGGRVWRRRDL